MSPSTAVATILTALLIGAMSPGPSFVIVARNSIGLSRRDGLATALGMGIGGVLFSGVALLGLYTLLAAVTWLYVSLKVAGGLYLIYLGVQTFRSASREQSFPAGEGVRGGGSAFRQGVIVEATNPKTAAFFLAFIPQFINVPAGHVPLQFLVMGVICVALNTGADLVAVLGAARLHRRLVERPQMFKRLRQGSGLLMVSLGAGVLAMKRS